jgi:hypothetical protein
MLGTSGSERESLCRCLFAGGYQLAVQLAQTAFGYVLVAGCVFSAVYLANIVVTHASHPAVTEVFGFLIGSLRVAVIVFLVLFSMVLFLLALNHLRIHKRQITAVLVRLMGQWWNALLLGLPKRRRVALETENASWWGGRHHEVVYDPGEFLVATLTRWDGTMLQQVLGDPIGKPTFYALMVVHACLYYTDSHFIHLEPLDTSVVIGLPVALMVRTIERQHPAAPAVDQ